MYCKTENLEDSYIHSMECQNDADNYNSYIHPDSEPHLRPTMVNRTPLADDSMENRQLRTTPATKLLANTETVRVSLQSRLDYSRYDAHAKKINRPTNGLSQERSYLELDPHSYLVKTPEVVLRRNRIQIKEVAIPFFERISQPTCNCTGMNQAIYLQESATEISSDNRCVQDSSQAP